MPAQPERVVTERTGERPAADTAVRSAPATAPATDQVVLSPAALAYDPEAAATQANAQRIAAIRAQIANGTYLTEDKLEIALERLFEEVRPR
ncbi:MAG: flagellar biosynthesis anti-sigma factor FlgM [Phycisphaerales bacterium]|nr:flagellar biosynthesis anti-sigma factor FlgM [Phycisphaerales bacterium]